MLERERSLRESRLGIQVLFASIGHLPALKILSKHTIRGNCHWGFQVEGGPAIQRIETALEWICGKLDRGNALPGAAGPQLFTKATRFPQSFSG
jgi:hypothetical protein